MLNLYQMTLPEKVIDRVKYEYITYHDTVIDFQKEFDTVYISRTNHVHHYDTIHHNELVYIRDSVHQYQFREPNYTLGIYAVRLDKYKLDIHARDTVTVIQHNTVETVTKKKDNRFGVGLFAGPSYDAVNRKMGASIGLGLTFRLTK